jgi:hypothetical protein
MLIYLPILLTSALIRPVKKTFAHIGLFNVGYRDRSLSYSCDIAWVTFARDEKGQLRSTSRRVISPRTIRRKLNRD